eukprot:310289-Ditylum_brightwellii.AAC.1
MLQPEKRKYKRKPMPDTALMVPKTSWSILMPISWQIDYHDKVSIITKYFPCPCGNLFDFNGAG